jgi:hypothetical protein
MPAKLQKRKTTKTEAAEAAAPVETKPTRTLSTRAIDPTKVAAQAQAAMTGGGGGGTSFLKLDASSTTLRIYPGDPLFMSYRQNTTRIAGRMNTTVAFDTVFENPEVHQRALEEGKITADDFAKYQKFGDPFISTMIAVKQAGLKLPKGKAFWPQTKVLWNAINRADGQLYLWDSSKTAFEAIMTHFGKLDDNGVFAPGQYPELFNEADGFDIIITGNGKEGLERRYTAFTPAREQSPLGEFDGEPNDLIGQVVRRVSTWDDRARQMFASYGSIAASVNIHPSTWDLDAVSNAGVDPEGDIDKDPEA